MRKILPRFLSILLILLLLTPVSARAAEGEIYYPDLSDMIQNEDRRNYVEAMIGYYIQTDPAVRQTLQEGYSALFFFEGCSDNMDDPELSDVSYYRVSTVCVAVKLRDNGKPYLAYFNDDSSTLPDRPLSYGAWHLDGKWILGPATICDGTYELYSVKHGGAYEALHLRTSEEDDTIPAVYMTEEGYVQSRADSINIHTRNVNHILKKAMWSAGCILIGDGKLFDTFTELVASTYYSIYDDFDLGRRVGTVTIDRQWLREEMYALYENQDAVDLLLAFSRKNHPETYLRSCTEETVYEEPQTLMTVQDTVLMTLPCSSATDSRSVEVAQLPKGEKLTVTASLRNSAGNLWLKVEKDGRTGYLYAGYVREPRWLDWLIGKFSD